MRLHEQSVFDELFEIIVTQTGESNDKIVCYALTSTIASSMDDDVQSVLDWCGLWQYVNMPTRGDSLLDVLASGIHSAIADVTVDDASQISDHVRPSSDRLSCVTPFHECLQYRTHRGISRPSARFNSSKSCGRRLYSRIQLRLQMRSSNSLLRSSLPRWTCSRRSDQDTVVVRELHRGYPKPLQRLNASDGGWKGVFALLHGRDKDRVTSRQCCRTTKKLITDPRRHHFQQRLNECPDPRSHWRTVDELLHKNERVRSTDNENERLCDSYFLSSLSSENKQS